MGMPTIQERIDAAMANEACTADIAGYIPDVTEMMCKAQARLAAEAFLPTMTDPRKVAALQALLANHMAHFPEESDEDGVTVGPRIELPG